MSYRINLYPEREVRRRDHRRDALRGLAAGLPLGVALLIVASLIVTGRELTRQRSALEASIRDLQASAAAASGDPAQSASRLIRDRRLDRIDWAVLLSEMSKGMPDAVSLTELRGLGRGRSDENRKLVLIGHLPESTGDLSPVMDFIGSLRAGPETSVDFPLAVLETATGGAWVDFQITCSVPGRTP